MVARRKLATRSSVARQSAITLKLSMNQRMEDWTWVKAPAAIIRPPKVSSLRKYSGAAARIGATRVNQPYPAVTQVRLVSPSTMRLVAPSTAATSALM